MMLVRRALAPIALLLLATQPAQAFFIDGDGHYGLRGETQTSPAFSKKRGTYQAIEQTFRLTGEARFNDTSSFLFETRLFEDDRESYLGNYSRPPECDGSKDNASPANRDSHPCNDKHQNTGEPGYKPYIPRITKAYVRYAFDYCILEAGRRGRDWGLGILLDSGTDPFEKGASIFDGVTCHVNIQKSQTLGFSVGYDKLAETGVALSSDQKDRTFGPTNPGDDIDQYFFTIEYDDRRANAGAAFTKNIGVYFAQINSKPLKDGGSNTDLKYLDLYTGFFLYDLAFRNEILFRMGKSADPNWQRLGGLEFSEGDPATNRLQSIAFAGNLEWTFARSGAAIGPADFRRGDATRHLLFFNYAYAPGDASGYYSDNHVGMTANDNVGKAKRDSRVEAVAFHRNFKPAMLLFNVKPEAQDLRVDGAFDPSRVINSSVFSAGYRYESLDRGNFEVKLVTASLIEEMPGDLKRFYQTRSTTGTNEEEDKRPAGFYGKNLGLELDLAYSYRFGREAAVGLAGAAALPGDAWRVSTNTKPANNFSLQSFVIFNF